MIDLGFGAICAVTLVGAMGQRALGMGFGLVAMPVLVLVLGPLPAVTAMNAMGAVASLLVLAQVWRLVHWRRLIWLLLPALLGVVPGILLARLVDEALLKAVMGAMILIGVGLSAWLHRTAEPIAGNAPVAVTGLIAGVLNGSVGLAAPAVGIYGALGDWPQRAYAAALQPFFLIMSATTVVATGLLDPSATLAWTWWMWLILGSVIVAGVLVGARIASRLPERAARRSILVLSFLGGVSVLWSGLAGLLA
ncbi:sulfite exporter TauE/SafE family protein [Microbacterium stercoris]|uniref:Probable membrane transporter protein n=1 Tax=Microbacterium stercoris TaxID=2820289 RepID=A0A939QI57_9MICO|nr:sulfite exporter TauE/SafE family protein [Microbacterium stercoris]MBO3662510.1 sulfite exporter TauE/SafE family protein [Microbacterium stercoris]MBO3664502.1 sulfite exporter TauE/SafE family protein [Microbacterium stercoris]